MSTDEEIIGPRGPRGTEGATGATGRAGAEGARGRQGEEGEQGEQGMQSKVTRNQLLVIFLLLVLAFSLLATRAEINQRAINRNAAEIRENAAEIALLVYQECQTRNATAGRQIALIDAAIAAEKRKPAPDQKQIADLTKFKPVIVDCGPKQPPETK